MPTPVPQAAIDLAKTVYVGHDGGAGCPGVEFVTAPNGTAVTYCFTVTNVGQTYLDTLTLTDADLNITRAQVTLLSGGEPLAPGASLVWFYETTTSGALVNTATVGGTPTDPSRTPLPNVPHPTDTDIASVADGDIINICQHACLSKLLPKPRGLDRQLLQFATLPIPPVDPTTSPFRVIIRNVNGIIYDQQIPAGAILETLGGWIYKSRDARVTGGLAQVRIYRGVKNGNPDVFRVAVKSFGEMTNLGPAEITVQVEMGGKTFLTTTTWTLLKSGWATWLPVGLP